MISPQSARIVIVGGGVGGASIAYHLAELGETDVLVLERAELTSGSTFHSAGLVGQLRADPTLTRMNMYSVELYRKLAQGEHQLGWTESGGIKLASSPQRLEEIRRQISWARTYGLPLHEISPTEAKDMFPLISTDGVVGARIPRLRRLPGPVPAVLCARQPRQGVGSEDCRTHPGARSSVIARADPLRSNGSRQCRLRGRRQLWWDVRRRNRPDGRRANPGGAHVAPVPDHRATARPRLGRVADAAGSGPLVYFRQEVDGSGDGRIRADARALDLDPDHVRRDPQRLQRPPAPEDWGRMEELAANAARRVPAMATIGVRKIINGPEAFTPDNEFCLGETEVAGLFVAAGFCAHGIAGAGGIGRVMAEWIVAGEPSFDVCAHGHQPVRHASTDHRRTPWRGPWRPTRRYYDIPFPGLQAHVRPTAARISRLRVARRTRRPVRREGGVGAGGLV